MKKSALSIVVLSIMLVACGGGAKSSDTKESGRDEQGAAKESNSGSVQLQNKEVFVSVYDNSATTVCFGAFKTTAKKEVKGWFTNFDVKGITEAEKVEEIFENVSIKIDVNSLDTKNQGRNAKLLAHFFGKTTSSETITGKVLSFDVENKSAVLELNFNDVKHPLTFSYDLKGDTLVMNSVLNLEDVNGMEALASINKACEALHKGDDGISKTWSEVNIYLSTVLNMKKD